MRFIPQSHDTKYNATMHFSIRQTGMKIWQAAIAQCGAKWHKKAAAEKIIVADNRKRHMSVRCSLIVMFRQVFDWLDLCSCFTVNGKCWQTLLRPLETPYQILTFFSCKATQMKFGKYVPASSFVKLVGHIFVFGS